MHAAYASDKEVAADTQLQAFAAALVAPHGANLGRINADGNKLETRAQLAKFIEDFVSIVLTHGSAHLQVNLGYLWSAQPEFETRRETCGRRRL